MSKARSISAVAGALVALLGLSLAARAAGLGPRPRAGPRAAIVVTGSLTGLYPGSRRRLQVSLLNRLRVPVRLTALRVAVRDGRWNCRGANVRVGRYRGRLVLPPRRRRKIRLMVSMPKSTGDPCQGAVFRLVFKARAVPA